MRETIATRCPKDVLYDSDEDLEYEPPTQSISGRNIDPAKLKILLRTKFGAGSFEIQIIQNTYCINAPRKLSNRDVEEGQCLEHTCAQGHVSLQAMEKPLCEKTHQKLCRRRPFKHEERRGNFTSLIGRSEEFNVFV
ncbi:hypothetical protein HBI56_136300 [Parastagonospora nodorum]|nr:hypothetical protein HBH53_208210 [Parastagonospora nodorum]KAH3959713.1 hypothetical protein HBH52_242010 [Parastagonospora nodorum]KAH4049859.1 hypothetical protein HBH49_138410 [Parastagonospora nodorum]KAH4075463.1 hypothetical protein HBH50_017080 [Parastagonospora nodorum]KAH4079812.1 hypothetical protein HBH46_232390 [Parastagonospora nodorum]